MGSRQNDGHVGSGAGPERNREHVPVEGLLVEHLVLEFCYVTHLGGHNTVVTNTGAIIPTSVCPGRQ